MHDHCLRTSKSSSLGEFDKQRTYIHFRMYFVALVVLIVWIFAKDHVIDILLVPLSRKSNYEANATNGTQFGTRTRENGAKHGNRGSSAAKFQAARGTIKYRGSSQWIWAFSSRPARGTGQTRARFRTARFYFYAVSLFRAVRPQINSDFRTVWSVGKVTLRPLFCELEEV